MTISTVFSTVLKSFKNKTQWKDLVGDAQGFSLESRVFHSICIALLVLASIYIPYNFYAGLYFGSLSAFVFAVIFSFQYCRSRLKRKRHSTTIFASAGLIIFGINYFTNSGISGSTDLIWPSYLLLVLAVSPYQEHVKWLLIYLVCFFAIHYIEYLRPDWIQHPFVAGKGQFIDRVTAFPIPVFVVFIIIRFIRRSYDIERTAAANRATALEESNNQIFAQKEQLEKSNTEKNKLMSIISHDLRAPLINIQSYLELLSQSEIDDESKPRLEQSLMRSTNGAIQMLSNFLNWSKSQMDGVSVVLKPISLKNSLQSVLEMEAVAASKKAVTLSSDIPIDLFVLADINMLQVVVRNLISNAIKFTPKDGLIAVNATEHKGECKLSVCDNGIGIPVEKQQKIFSINAEPTYGTNNEKGIGLGLVLSKEFIERQGGRIDFYSTTAGSSFAIYLPLAQHD